jgi:peptide/nickel transport system permease protein
MTAAAHPNRPPAKAGRLHPLARVARFAGATVLAAVPVFLLATLVTFLLGWSSGLDPAAALAGDNATPEAVAQIRERFGLDRPVALQYLGWMSGILRGDLGTSWFNGVPVLDLIVQRLPVSMSIAGAALLVGVVAGAAAGIAAATRQGSRFDRAVTLFASIAAALPPFVISIAMILLFSLWLGLLPAAGYVPPFEDFAGWLTTIAMPSLALSIELIADVARQLRTGLVAALAENYVTGAMVRGLSPRRILFVHVLRNGAGPALSLLALRVPTLIGGAVVSEAIFNMPGMGRLAADSALRGDVPVVQGTLVVAIVLVLASNLLIEVLLGLLQPASRRRA